MSIPKGQEQYVEEVLLDIGYYRLGFYWFPMEEDYPQKERRNHSFKEGAAFETSVRLYEFDKELRGLLSNYLLDIEVNLRTKVIYYISNHYKDNPVWFADNRIVMSSYVQQLDRRYQQEVSNNDVIKRHSKKHINDKYAPAWKTLEYISFGDLVRLIENIKDPEVKRMIYACYGFIDDKSFPNYIEVVRKLRNLCAHGHPIFDFALEKSLRAGKFKGRALPDGWNSNMQGALLVVQYFMFYISPRKGVQFRDKIKELCARHIKRYGDIRPMVEYLQETPWLDEKL